AGTRPADIASIEEIDSAVRIALATSQGHRIGARTLARESTCQDLAAAAAVVIAAWESSAQTEFVPSLPRAPVTVAVALAPVPRRSRWSADAGFAAAIEGGNFAPGAALGFSLAPAGGRAGVRATAALSLSQQRTLGGGHVLWSRWPLMVGPEWTFA